MEVRNEMAQRNPARSSDEDKLRRLPANRRRIIELLDQARAIRQRDGIRKTDDEVNRFVRKIRYGTDSE